MTALAPPKTSTARARLCRKRQREGRAQLHVDVDFGALLDALVECGFLEPCQEDRRSIERAASRLLAVVTNAKE